ncbi:MAG: cystathionine beta-synthase [Planctomycetota bacterium]|jgi:cystathionine beta-synthase
MKRVYNNILETIGDTPIVKLNNICKEIEADVYVKIESTNPGNSVKDRMALSMVNAAEKDGSLKPGGTIVEGTSGNTGMGLALIAIIRGYKCIFVTTDKQSKEKVDILKAVGAEVIVCPTDVDASDPRSYYSTSARIASETPGAWYVNQYDNPYNALGHYESTAPEIWDQTDGKITHFVAGVGTGGTISGCGKYFKEKNPAIKMLGIDTYGSVLKKYHETGELDPNEIYPYITEGIGEDILPENVDFSVIDHFEKVTDKDGAVYTRRLAKEEGIFAGYSAGSAIKGLIQMKDQFKKGDVVIILLHDHGSRYVGKVYNDEWMKQRGWLDAEPTAKSIVETKNIKELITVDSAMTLSEAFAKMKKFDISQMPVQEKNEIVGSLTEKDLLNALLENITKDVKVKEIMSEPFEKIHINEKVSEISKKINKTNSAVIVEDIAGMIHVITEYDLIDAIAG